MNGQAIAAQPLAHAGSRALASEVAGPQPGGTRADATGAAAEESRSGRAEAETRTAEAPPERRTAQATRP